MNGWDMSGWAWIWMTFVMGGGLLAAVLLVMLVTQRSTINDRPAREETPEAILGKRLARGEIDEEEYRRRHSMLRSTDGSSAH